MPWLMEEVTDELDRERVARALLDSEYNNRYKVQNYLSNILKTFSKYCLISEKDGNDFAYNVGCLRRPLVFFICYYICSAKMFTLIPPLPLWKIRNGIVTVTLMKTWIVHYIVWILNV